LRARVRINFVASSGWQTHWHKHTAVRTGDELIVGEEAADPAAAGAEGE